MTYDAREMHTWAELGIAPLPIFIAYAAPTLSPRGFVASITIARAVAIAFTGVPLVLLAWWWLRREAGIHAAAIGAALVALSPNIVAHASLAATDACFVLWALVALAALAAYIDAPAAGTVIALGVGVAMAFAAKYSAVGVLAIVPVAIVAARHRANVDMPTLGRALVEAAAVTAAVVITAFVLTWAMHGFAMANAMVPRVGAMRLPAPIAGVLFQVNHQRGGHYAFLLGTYSTAGWWYYMPVALLLKSTPAELIVFAALFAALTLGWHTASTSALVWRVAFLVFGALSLLSRVDTGIRYVLLLVPLAIFIAVEQAVRAPIRNRIPVLRVGAALVVVQAVSSVLAAPHYLSYFNVLAGGSSEGYRYLADSNVDWGQDLPALRETLARVGAKHPVFAYFGTAPQEEYGVHADPWTIAAQPAEGSFDWIAISTTFLDDTYGGHAFEPFRAIAPSARAAYSIMLYDAHRPDVRAAFAITSARLANTSGVQPPAP